MTNDHIGGCRSTPLCGRPTERPQKSRKVHICTTHSRADQRPPAARIAAKSGTVRTLRARPIRALPPLIRACFACVVRFFTRFARQLGRRTIALTIRPRRDFRRSPLVRRAHFPRAFAYPVTNDCRQLRAVPPRPPHYKIDAIHGSRKRAARAAVNYRRPLHRS